MKKWSACLLGLFVSVASLPVNAHEFWLQPRDFEVAPGDTIEADIRVGSKFKGGVYSYMPKGFVRFDYARGDTVAPIEGRLGDVPAASVKTDAPGLYVLIHQSTNQRLVYKDAETFKSFVTHKDFAWALEENKKRGLPEFGFTEAFSRFAKTLVAVGDGAGSDREYGLETEIVANANPYTDDLGGKFPLTVLYQGKPRRNTQLEMYEKAPDGTIEITVYRTDDKGQATIDVRPGHIYMVDAVVFRQPDRQAVQEMGAVWQSLWANLTFEVPAD
ncbi:DUF4198 domain-containing protein [Brevirhabdus sp.]|uniref:DUF4198 domain-containing protein n=1 Tax=Brevirhabdus sp. TaxID=2004514 RepID=UPI0040597B0A